MFVYYPSCNFTMASKEGSNKIKEYLKEKHGMRIEGCCRPGHKTLTDQDTAITICQSCSAIIRENIPKINEISVWEILDNDKDFPWPDLKGENITLQDCWRAKDKRLLQDAVRSIMKKMNIEIIELEDNYQKSEFCGVFRYNPMRETNIKIAPNYFINQMVGKLELHNEEEQKKLMEEHCKLYSTDRVVCYCNSCLRGAKQGGVNGVHLMDIIMQTS